MSQGPGDYEAILLDLDGTLLGDDEEVAPESLAAIERARSAGKEVLVATGRSKTSAMPVLDAIGVRGPAVLFNGCAVYDTAADRMLEERLISNRTGEALHGWGAARELQVIVMTADQKLAMQPRSPEEEKNFDGLMGVDFVERHELVQENTLRLSFMVKCDEEGARAVAQEVEAFAPGPIYVLHFTLSTLPRHRTNPYSAIDVHAPCRGKAEALRFLSESKGIDPAQVIAVGDADTDLSMVQAAGLGVAMGNAIEPLKAAADLVIADNNSAAIPELIDRYLLGR